MLNFQGQRKLTLAFQPIRKAPQGHGEPTHCSATATHGRIRWPVYTSMHDVTCAGIRSLLLCNVYAQRESLGRKKYKPSFYWPFLWGIHRWPVNSPHKGQWRGTLMFSMICAWTNGWVNNREADDLRCHRAHYDVTVILTKGDGNFSRNRVISFVGGITKLLVIAVETPGIKVIPELERRNRSTFLEIAGQYRTH